jgi:intracellular sulfur oxidation DsrE/DsrF family protein
MMRWLALCLFLASTGVAAGEASVKALLEREQPPPGVVFELVENDHEALETLLPRLRSYIGALRARHPDMGIAVVSHGNEQFSLLTEQRDARPQLHRHIEELVRGEDVEVSVCATYAGWRDIPPESFPDYVQVAESGPARINDFRALGYEVIRLRPPGASVNRPEESW